MSYIKFDKTELVNLEYSLSRELVRSNRAGSFASTTIINCNTRKYHGLLICPIENLGNENHILLSNLHETIIQKDAEFHLGIQKYSGEYFPRGHKYIKEFDVEPTISVTYRVGGVILKREMLLVEEEERIFIRYTLLDAHSPTKLRLQPFLAFRNIHMLTHSNLLANTKYQSINNGIKIKMYEEFPFLHMQTSKKSTFVPVPDWYYNIQYLEEKKRGYEFEEDLFVPGYFEMALKKGDSVVFAAGIKEVKTLSLNRQFNNELARRVVRTNFENCLENAAQQFISRRNGKTKIIAGFPWFGHWSRDTFIALPGLTLARGDTQTFIDVIDTSINEMRNCFFINEGNKVNPERESADASLWLFYALQKYDEEHDDDNYLWEKYGKHLKNILNCYKNGTDNNIKMHDSGLLWIGSEGSALTWMDVTINNVPVTPRFGFVVEINALWYNAVMYALKLARNAGDDDFVKNWEGIPKLIKKSFIDTFWNNSKGYLADYVNNINKDWKVRPNQLFAISLPFSCLTNKMKKSVLDIIKQELLTTKGIRTLSPKNSAYKGRYEGNEISRKKAYHQGSVRPWLIGHYVEAYLKIHNKNGVSVVEKIYNNFEDCMNRHGIGTISEIYDGDPPHRPNGATSFALSVAELIRTKKMLEKYY